MSAPATNFVLPKPGPVLRAVLIGLFAIWLAFAIGINWGGVPMETFLLFAGNTDRILAGEVWRLFTAPLLHAPSLGGIFGVLVGLYFLTPTLEEKWGGARLARFLILSGLFAYLFQIALQKALPASIAGRLVGAHWFSALPIVEAIAIAWALTFKGQTVRLFFILPITSRGLILFVIGISVLFVITLEQPMIGLIAPFGGILAGWLFGGGTPSPARKLWLKVRLKRLEQEAARDRSDRKKRIRRSGLSVIKGGNEDEQDDRKGPDGKWLN